MWEAREAVSARDAQLAEILGFVKKGQPRLPGQAELNSPVN